MKKRITLVMIVVVGLSLVLPASGFSWYYGPGPYYGYRGGCCYGNGWGWGLAIAGGLVAGVLIGNMIADQSRPGPTVVRQDPRIAYAYPDPAFIAKYGDKPAKDVLPSKEAPPGGEWVTVPGQWAGSVWVPEHKVWVASEGSTK